MTESDVLDTTVGGYLRRLSSPSAVPGGGSAAALSGALGAALLAMVARLSEKRATGPEIRAELDAVALECDHLIDQMAALSQEDIDAYGSVLAARRLPKDEPVRAGALAEAQEAATRVPLRTATLARRGLDLLDQLRPLAWEMLASDVHCARLLLVTAFEGGLANVAINLPDVADGTRVQLERAVQALRADSGRR